MLGFDQLLATPASAASAQSPVEKAFDTAAGIFLDDQSRVTAFVLSIKAKLSGRGDVADEWRFCGDESNTRRLLGLPR